MSDATHTVSTRRFRTHHDPEPTFRPHNAESSGRSERGWPRIRCRRWIGFRCRLTGRGAQCLGVPIVWRRDWFGIQRQTTTRRGSCAAPPSEKRSSFEGWRNTSKSDAYLWHDTPSCSVNKKSFAYYAAISSWSFTINTPSDSRNHRKLSAQCSSHWRSHDHDRSRSRLDVPG